MQDSKTPFRAGKKAVPPSFVEVIDFLVDLVVRYRPPEPVSTPVPPQEGILGAAEQAEASAGAEGAAAGPAGSLE